MTLDGINSRIAITKSKISKLEDIATRNISNEAQREKTAGKNKAADNKINNIRFTIHPILKSPKKGNNIATFREVVTLKKHSFKKINPT